MGNFLLIICLAIAPFAYQPATIYQVNVGKIEFVSVAPLETITASSVEVSGLLNTVDNTFAFSVYNTSFQGFNSALQREHFNENYMESDLFPLSTFAGKIIEKVNLNEPGEYDIRAKGVLDIHGVKQERIIRCRVNVTSSEARVRSNFTVLLEDHRINIPRIVNQKLFPEINVSVDVTLKPK